MPIRAGAAPPMLDLGTPNTRTESTHRKEHTVIMFNQLGNMAKMVQAAPGLIDQANALAAQSQAYRRHLDVMAVQAMTAEPARGALEPIAGVDLDRYARIVKGIAAFAYDEAKLPVIAGMFGVDAESWATAQAGWGARIQADRGVGRRFNEIYAVV